jgi:hypothetical protein
MKEPAIVGSKRQVRPNLTPGFFLSPLLQQLGYRLLLT